MTVADAMQGVGQWPVWAVVVVALGGGLLATVGGWFIDFVDELELVGYLLWAIGAVVVFGALAWLNAGAWA